MHVVLSGHHSYFRHDFQMLSVGNISHEQAPPVQNINTNKTYFAKPEKGTTQTECIAPTAEFQINFLRDTNLRYAPMMPPRIAGAYAPVPPSTPVAGAWGMAGPYAHVPPPMPASVPGPSGVAGASAPPHTSPGGSMDSQETDVKGCTQSYDINDLSILQWNVKNWTQKNYKFREDVIRRLNPDIICLNETKLRRNETIELADYELFGHTRLKLKITATCEPGGVAFLIKSSVACKFNITCVDKLFEGIL